MNDTLTDRQRTWIEDNPEQYASWCEAVDDFAMFLLVGNPAKLSQVAYRRVWDRWSDYKKQIGAEIPDGAPPRLRPIK